VGIGKEVGMAMYRDVGDILTAQRSQFVAALQLLSSQLPQAM
jgi:hypothetical protein